MTPEQRSFMQALAQRKRAILIGTLPLQPLFWYGVFHTIPGADIGAGIVCIASFAIGAWATLLAADYVGL